MYCLRNVKSKLKTQKKKERKKWFQKKSEIFYVILKMTKRKKKSFKHKKKKSGEFWSIINGLLKCRHFICTEMFIKGLQLLRTRLSRKFKRTPKNRLQANPFSATPW